MSKSGSNDGNLLSLAELFKSTKVFCVQCRKYLSSSSPLRCSRCKIVHYCDKACQKAHYAFHKHDCRKIHDLRDLLNVAVETQDVSETNEINSHKYNLAYAIVQLGYKSTDTINRGKFIYERALLEYLGIMRRDPFFIGACESAVLLLAYIGYDRTCQSLIKFMLDPPKFSTSSDGQDRIRHYTKMVSDLEDDIWIYGPITESATRIAFSEYDKIRDKIPKCWGANVFLVPLMLITMRQCADSSLSSSSRKPKILQSVGISRQVEYSSDFTLPVLLSLFPDSRQRWEKEEVCGLFANLKVHHEEMHQNLEVDEQYRNTRWEASCLIYWHLLKDCYALTPGILDVLEETIDEMVKLGINVVAETPDAPTVREHMEFISMMAERQRNGTSLFD